MTVTTLTGAIAATKSPQQKEKRVETRSKNATMDALGTRRRSRTEQEIGKETKTEILTETGTKESTRKKTESDKTAKGSRTNVQKVGIKGYKTSLPLMSDYILVAKNGRYYTDAFVFRPESQKNRSRNPVLMRSTVKQPKRGHR